MKFKETLKGLISQASEIKKDDLIGFKNDAIEKAKKIKSEFDDHLLNAKEARLLRQEQNLGEKEISLNKLEEELNQKELDLNRLELEIKQAQKRLAVVIISILLAATVLYAIYGAGAFQSKFKEMHSIINQEFSGHLKDEFIRLIKIINEFIKNESPK